MAWLMPLFGYLLGSIPTAYIAGRLGGGKDIRRLGDGNMGAQNAFRQIGPAIGILVGVIDAGKGALPVLLAQAAGLPQSVVFVTGGDVEEGMRVLEATGTVGLLGELAAAGKPFIGVSAGSIMLARSWVRWRDPDDESTAETFPCLGIAPVVCDTHGEADAWEELAAMVGISPEGTVGHGIPSGAGLVVHPDGSLEAAGAPVNRFERREGRTVPLADLEPPLGRATAPPVRT